MMRVLRGLGGRLLACGCLVGTYETYDASVVTTIDVRGPECSDPAHRRHRRLTAEPEPAATGPGAPVRTSH